jgi:hypothetical protein
VALHIVPLELVEAGERAVSDVESSVASGAHVLRCLLLASRFYEALRDELRRTERGDFRKRALLAAAAERCNSAAVERITPQALLTELRAALAVLESGEREAVPLPAKSRPVLRVINGGLI